jgi:hypothetical protein
VGEIIREPIEKMMCPQASNMPVAEAHVLHNRLVDALSNATKEYENEDGDLPEPLDKAYMAVAYGSINTDMDLFVHSVAVRRHGRYVTVESWWWKCPTCGFILPASRVPERTEQ